jgi:hypothetical protein
MIGSSVLSHIFFRIVVLPALALPIMRIRKRPQAARSSIVLSIASRSLCDERNVAPKTMGGVRACSQTRDTAWCLQVAKACPRGGDEYWRKIGERPATPGVLENLFHQISYIAKLLRLYCPACSTRKKTTVLASGLYPEGVKNIAAKCNPINL